MADIEYDVDWFKGQIDIWEDFRVTLYDYWGQLSMAKSLPEINERFPDTLQQIVPKLESANEKLIDNLYKGKDEMTAMKDAMVQTAETYIANNAQNQEEIDSLTEVIES